MASVDRDGRVWGRRGCGHLSEGGGGQVSTAPHHPPLRTPQRGQLWGWGEWLGDRWGHGPAPLCCQHGGKTLRVRAELGVGDALNRMRNSSFCLDQSGERSRSDWAGEGVSGPLPDPSCSFRTQWPLQRHADAAGPLPTGSRNQRLQLTAQPMTPKEVSGCPAGPLLSNPAP